MSVTLFDIAQSVREAVNQIDPETGEIVDGYAENRELFQSKALGCIAYSKEEAATIEAAWALISEMQRKIEARAKRHEKFLAYMADCMKATGITEVKHELGLFGAKLYIGRDESVELLPGTAFPPELCSEPKPPAPNKTKIKAAIKAGEAVAGARIVRKDRLTIT